MSIRSACARVGGSAPSLPQFAAAAPAAEEEDVADGEAELALEDRRIAAAALAKEAAEVARLCNLQQHEVHYESVGTLPSSIGRKHSRDEPPASMGPPLLKSREPRHLHAHYMPNNNGYYQQAALGGQQGPMKSKPGGLVLASVHLQEQKGRQGSPSSSTGSERSSTSQCL